MKRLGTFFASLVALLAGGSGAQAQEAKGKVLFVVTSHSELGNTGKKTGYYLSEVSHPWKVLHEAGYAIDFVSPKGGTPPVDDFNLGDAINSEFWNNSEYNAKINSSKSPAEVNAAEYKGIFYAGGHGAMWDLPYDEAIAAIAAKIYEAGGVVGGVCHGPAGLVNIKLSDGSYLVSGKRVNAFTDEEEDIVGATDIVPFALETTLRERGAIIEKSEPWQVHVSSDKRVVTGQNPMSATAVGEGMKYALRQVK